METTVLTPETRVDETSVPSRNITAPAAVLAGVAALGTALLSGAILATSGLALLALLLGISALAGSKGRRGSLVASFVAMVLSLGSIGALVVADHQAAAASGQMTVQSDVTNSPVEITYGAVVPNIENSSTTVTVSVTNLGDHTVSTWASISATSASGSKTYASQGVGVRDLEPGETSTQEITFGAVLPASTKFVVKDVL
jgi:hypothetical protein